MYHCFWLTSVITVTSYSRTKSMKDPTHGGRQRQIDHPQEHTEENRRQNHHDRRRVHFLLRRPGDALQFVANFGEKRAAPVPPAGDVLSRFSDVVDHVRCHVQLSSAFALRATARQPPPKVGLPTPAR